MALTRPSIMSLGATISAPAWARLAAVRAEQIERGIVVDFEAVAAFDNHAAVAVAGVFAKADVGDEDQLFGGAGSADGAQRPCCTMPFRPGAGALLILAFRQAEKQQATQAEAGGFFSFANRFIDREIEDAGHGADSLRRHLRRGR